MRRISPSLIIAVLALVLACSGGAFAASTLITGKQIKNSSITGADIRNKSLTPADFRGSVRGDTGPAGPQGLTGAAGPQGVQGPAGPSTTAQITRMTQQSSVGPGQIDGPTASCPSGQGIVSGGVITAGVGYVFADDSFGGRSWSVGYDNYYGSVSADVTAVAYCAPSGSAITTRSVGTKGPSFADTLAARRAAHSR